MGGHRRRCFGRSSDPRFRCLKKGFPSSTASDTSDNKVFSYFSRTPSTKGDWFIPLPLVIIVLSGKSVQQGTLLFLLLLIILIFRRVSVYYLLIELSITSDVCSCRGQRRLLGLAIDSGRGLSENLVRVRGGVCCFCGECCGFCVYRYPSILRWSSQLGSHRLKSAGHRVVLHLFHAFKNLIITKPGREKRSSQTSPPIHPSYPRSLPPPPCPVSRSITSKDL